MPFIELPIVWVVLLDAVAWTFFHLAISFWTVRISFNWFVRHERLFHTFRFERQGDLWQQFFRVKRWKQLIPDGTMFIKNGYNKQSLHGNDLSSLDEFIIESRRAELTHWLSIIPAALFFLWNPLWASWLNVAYAVLFNGPIIIAQRYNRPRLERLVARKRNKPQAESFIR
ncbi:glycosyl-4,4'-diaponeurosporenoate acyltransferase [Sporosarcina sp. BI001-red]|uniref:glycosyl-4,4'-diaponeurosporenoate acyltransferase CrtO family protein n=1 Tax=Sporosarcina sp. BI001-red TaxID=2282866 RepID=UPI000E26516F|nr:glycosyl-4,4'-diaponeurosporenoate acyltransferase [Sporosarcina sp. BI001-red]REB07815.1 glycosyl-4,4'-diaponeurosporenoate acyltransferase [Sporosarcina sp. BI001-red]